MAKIISVLPKGTKQDGTPITCYIPIDIRDCLKKIGGGKIALGLRIVLTTFETEIKEAAKKSK